jgi:hypothetical protein
MNFTSSLLFETHRKTIFDVVQLLPGRKRFLLSCISEEILRQTLKKVEERRGGKKVNAKQVFNQIAFLFVKSCFCWG